MKTNLLFPAFFLMILAQLYIPSKMILDSRGLLRSGKEYKFLTAPIDPTDPFRGKYISLNFQANAIEIKASHDWKKNDPVFVLLDTDQQGYARIRAVTHERPRGDSDYIQASVRQIIQGSNHKLIVEYPFNRYYIEESKAAETEKIYLDSMSSSSSQTYAVVMVKDGEALIKDIFISGISIKEINFQKNTN